MDIALAQQNNERIVKTYFCTNWALLKMQGNLTVTTERVIFHGSKKDNRIVQEAEIKSISGLSSFYGTKINWIWLLVGAAVFLGGLLGAISCVGIINKMEKMGYIPAEIMMPAILGFILGLCATIGGMLIICLLGFGKAFFLNIYSSQSAGTPISLGNADRANLVLLSLSGQPTFATDFMMKELGALITDLKTDKEEAFRVWGPKVEPEGN